MKTITVLTAMFFAALLSSTAFVANAAEIAAWENEASKCFNELNDAPLKDSLNASAVAETPASPDTRWPGVYFGAVHFPEREGRGGSTKKRNVCIKIAVMAIQVEDGETNWAGQYCYGAGYQARATANCYEQSFRDTLIEEGGDVLIFSMDGERGIIAFRIKLDSAGEVAHGEVAYDDGRSWSILLKKKTATWLKKAGF